MMVEPCGGGEECLWCSTDPSTKLKPKENFMFRLTRTFPKALKYYGGV